MAFLEGSNKMKKAKEIPEEIFEHVKYDESSPTGLRWIKKRQNIQVGDVAGCKNPDGYWFLGFGYKTYRCHRIIYKLHHKINIQHTEIDHIDNNPSNNKIENLRIANSSEQKWNKRTYKNNSSGIKGVYWNQPSKKWLARIAKNGKRHHLGLFENLEDARIAVEKARKEMHGEFANHGTNLSAKKQ
jgi:hypothetical protein